MPDQIRCIDLDPSQTLLAVACGSQVTIYQRPSGAGFDLWMLLDRIARPCEGRGGLVNSAHWFGPTPCSLFVGYAEAGWT